MSSRLASFTIVLALSAGALGACHSRSRASEAAPAPATAAQGADFLAKMGKTAGVQTLPDGLEYKVARSGPADGQSPKLGDEVKVNYQGTLIDGTVFDSSYDRGEPAVFTVGEVIPGWNEALQKMRPGDVWYLYIPANLAYGDEGAGPIPAGAVLVFKIELLGLLPHGAGEGQG
jgi:peptidylprolyl isomerase/FKBP-type peptidyl-prolyl cis-trans isomerase FklB